MQREQWKHALITGLPKHMDASNHTEGVKNENTIGFKLVVYGVSIILQVEKHTWAYEFTLTRDVNDVIISFYRSESEFDVNNIVKELRLYARRHGTKLIDWQIQLADSFIDAGFSWAWTTGFVCNASYIKVLLSKYGVNFYFEMVYRRTVIDGNYYQLLDTSENPIKESKMNFGIKTPTLGSIVQNVLRFFSTQPKANGGPSSVPGSSAVGPVPVVTTSGGRPSPPSSNALKMHLYEIIIDLLLWVRTHGNDPGAAGVLESLRGIRGMLKE
jgi:hypothetical protein